MTRANRLAQKVSAEVSRIVFFTSADVRTYRIFMFKEGIEKPLEAFCGGLDITFCVGRIGQT